MAIMTTEQYKALNGTALPEETAAWLLHLKDLYLDPTIPGTNQHEGIVTMLPIVLGVGEPRLPGMEITAERIEHTYQELAFCMKGVAIKNGWMQAA